MSKLPTCNQSCDIRFMEHRKVRLLSRRYYLTVTSYKFLEIGINAGPPNYVEITLGDHREHETVTVSRNVEGPLQAAMEYLQDAAKRIQR
ncbi:hypothetical protein G5I_13547 [Acromyrmex echinatior]|uniref:Uncharacterized protein n=1 Tax=Acromyrmex echinatior TaxID=103372 RepID=F4X5B9_ACREC|nr:hypothetical protein G5I_13547 [Acromyrmex echinatior]